jgi:hypothetical protein
MRVVEKKIRVSSQAKIVPYYHFTFIILDLSFVIDCMILVRINDK